MNDTSMSKTIPAFKKTIVNIDDLVDICTVTINPSLPVPEKIRSYLQQIKTPELFRCDDTIIRISYASTGVTLTDRMKQYLLSKQDLSLT
jgi:hypothetical protein